MRICKRTIASCLLGAVLGAGVTSSVAIAKPKTVSEKVGERISRGVVEESLESLDKQENRERLGRIMGSPQMRKAMHDLTSSIVLGVFDGVREAKKGGALVGDIDVAKSVGQGMNEHVTPAAGRLTYRVVDSALSAALADKHIAQMEKMGKGATHAVVAGLAEGLEHELGPALAATLDKDIGPAVARMLERDIMPAVGRGLGSPEMQAAIANTTRSIATELVAGTAEQMDVETQKNEAAGKESGFALFGGRIALGYAIALLVAFAFATLFIVMTVLLVRSNRRQRRLDEEAKQREQTLMSLLDSIESDNPELRTDVHRLVRDQLHREP
jgi:hypothetical protein